MFRKLIVVLFTVTAMTFAKDNAVFLSLGYPGTTGIYYERTIKPVVLGFGPGVLFPLLTLSDPSFNPDLYLGFSVFRISAFRTAILVHAMYFYNYAQLVAADFSGRNSREDIILVGPDLAVAYGFKQLFVQVQIGTRSMFSKWFDGSSIGNFAFKNQLPSLSFSGGIGF